MKQIIITAIICAGLVIASFNCGSIPLAGGDPLIVDTTPRVYDAQDRVLGRLVGVDLEKDLYTILIPGDHLVLINAVTGKVPESVTAYYEEENCLGPVFLHGSVPLEQNGVLHIPNADSRLSRAFKSQSTPAGGGARLCESFITGIRRKDSYTVTVLPVLDYTLPLIIR